MCLETLWLSFLLVYYCWRLGRGAGVVVEVVVVLVVMVVVWVVVAGC